MNLLQINPVREIKGISNRLNLILDRFPNRKSSPELMAAPDWRLAVDISETDSEYLICGDIAGVKKADVSISFHNDMLTIQGERKAMQEGEGRKIHRMECPHGSFMRSFHMPEDADQRTVTVDYTDGMFILSLPKKSHVGQPAVDG